VPVESLLRTPWPGIVLWSGLYCSDWLLTLTCARLYRMRVSDTIVFEGSYEITPLYQSDIDSLRGVSPRFLIVLGVSALFLWWVWRDSESGLYAFVLGALVCVELVVHIRHLRNLFLFREIARKQSVRGRIEYKRDLLLFASSFEILSFAVLFIVVFAFSGSRFVLGGAIGSASLAVQHWMFARKHAAATMLEANLRRPAPPTLSR
jgi:hypothetical protein